MLEPLVLDDFGQVEERAGDRGDRDAIAAGVVLGLDLPPPYMGSKLRHAFGSPPNWWSPRGRRSGGVARVGDVWLATRFRLLAALPAPTSCPTRGCGTRRRGRLRTTGKRRFPTGPGSATRPSASGSPSGMGGSMPPR